MSKDKSASPSCLMNIETHHTKFPNSYPECKLLVATILQQGALAGFKDKAGWDSFIAKFEGGAK